VEKENFIEVLRHYSESSEEEALSVLSLRESYPYSQLLHTLAARVSKDHDFINHQKELQLAAVYASDRSVLKDIMTLDNLLDRRPHSSGKSDVENVAVVSPSQPVVIKAVSDGSYNVADEVLSDLEKLHELKHNFEQMFVDSVQVPKVIPVTSEKKEPVDNTVAAINKESSSSKDSSKTRKERIVELAKSMSAAKDEAPSEEPKQKGKKKNPSESFIEEIATTKQALEPENEKQKEQLQIIEQFIKTQPSIPNPKDKATATPAGDLSSIKTGEFNDNVVSETLVEILIKQGKKDKAIEVLKKLIWKFPQKKAYFAAQIEQLKSS
jgi:tetratricopeptide (TPR) repeat protein